MCLFFLSLHGCGQVIQLNDFGSCSLAFIANVVVMPTVSQEIFIQQLITFRPQVNHTKYNYINYIWVLSTIIYGCQVKFSVPFWIAYVVFG